MTISDIFEKYPEKAGEIAEILKNAGLFCVGCAFAGSESLEMGNA